ncbi:MAG: hypothetical protein ACXADW_22395 [Candidatus Hodarchaeales archaeon]|jgi:hypothetical protein
MSKFLDKKEQVIDFKLTSYGHYLIGNGIFEPAYYSFVDDNVVYDSEYFGRSGEAQNDIHTRIKQETQYLESLVLFEQVGNVNPAPTTDLNIFINELTPTEYQVRIDEFRLNSLIGDAFVGDDKQKVPSWKLVSLRNDISSSTLNDSEKNTKIPQINITANYRKIAVDVEDFNNISFNTSNQRVNEAVTGVFSDGKVVYLDMNDVMIYLEETNTEILNENFDIEVFLDNDGTLERKYFVTKQEQIVDGMMVTSNPVITSTDELTEDSIERYFSILVDREIESSEACKMAGNFNKDSYYIDLDFDCNNTETREDLFYDIYGSETEAEICQD